MTGDNVTEWIDRLARSDDRAAEQLVDRYYQKLVSVAQKKLEVMPPQVADDEGAVVSALRSFFSGVPGGQFPRLVDRDDLWRVLATITARKAIAQVRRHWKKRGEAGKMARSRDMDRLLSNDPSPDQLAEFLEECTRRIDDLKDETLREIVLLRLQGWETGEIAEKLSVHQRTIQRKLSLIQSEWLEASAP